MLTKTLLFLVSSLLSVAVYAVPLKEESSLLPISSERSLVSATEISLQNGNGGVYFCQEPNFGGHCWLITNVSGNDNVCLVFFDTNEEGTEYPKDYRGIRSFGPDPGIHCNLYNSDWAGSCSSDGSPFYDVQYPGQEGAGLAAHSMDGTIRSVKCCVGRQCPDANNGYIKYTLEGLETFRTKQ